MSIELIVAIVGAIIAWLVFKNSKKTRAVQLYLGFVSEYKSKEMLAAIEGLYGFKEEFEKTRKECWKCEYNKKRGCLLDTLKTAQPEMALSILENHLHHQRRLVSNFYHAIYIAAKHRTIPKKVIFAYWSEGALEIIKEVIEPVGQDPDKKLGALCEMEKTYRKKYLPISIWWRFLDFLI